MASACTTQLRQARRCHRTALLQQQVLRSMLQHAAGATQVQSTASQLLGGPQCATATSSSVLQGRANLVPNPASLQFPKPVMLLHVRLPTCRVCCSRPGAADSAGRMSPSSSCSTAHTRWHPLQEASSLPTWQTLSSSTTFPLPLQVAMALQALPSSLSPQTKPLGSYTAQHSSSASCTTPSEQLWSTPQPEHTISTFYPVCNVDVFAVSRSDWVRLKTP